MLLQLRDFIAREKRVSTEQITRAFNIDFSALEPMLTRFVLQGVIALEAPQNCQQECGGCKSLVAYYRFVL
jgi:hypothetical protein